jgi:ElaB/YqjD/DUF883 family membrane-anchored ribosome-binding protein
MTTPNVPMNTANGPMNTQAAQNLKQDTHRLKEDLRAIKDDSIALARDLKEDGITAAKNVGTDVKEKVDEMKTHASEHLGTIAKEVKARPLQSMAIAFAAGAVASLFIGRR